MTGLDIARCATVRNDMPVLLHSLEMASAEVADRLMAAEATGRLARLREGNNASPASSSRGVAHRRR